jgi:hypothetical protein
MDAQTAKARPHISYWEHLYDPTGDDSIQIAGQFGDGRVGGERKAYRADRNTACDHCGHSDILREPDKFSKWIDLGVIDRLR